MMGIFRECLSHQLWADTDTNPSRNVVRKTTSGPRPINSLHEQLPKAFSTSFFSCNKKHDRRSTTTSRTSLSSSEVSTRRTTSFCCLLKNKHCCNEKNEDSAHCAQRNGQVIANVYCLQHPNCSDRERDQECPEGMNVQGG
ncbi:unnamed protein product [Amoebophrya sp. A25]|nr:unnamed protein product [Amoebophrya sp. A25]|eukprot:GSA25T00015042001.1